MKRKLDEFFFAMKSAPYASFPDACNTHNTISNIKKRNHWKLMRSVHYDLRGICATYRERGANYLFVVTERLIEQGKSEVDVLGDGYGITLCCFWPSENFDTLPGDRLWRFPGKFGPSHVHFFSTINLHLVTKL